MKSNIDHMPREEYGVLYSIIIALDHIEKGFTRDSIEQSKYIEIVTRLLSHYSRLLTTLDSISSIDDFVNKYQIKADAGIRRIKLGIPATAEAINSQTSTNQGNGKAIAEVAGNFITFCDGVHLNFRGKDDLHPLLAELVLSLNKATKSDFEGRGKLVQWLIKLNALKPLEKISDTDSVEILTDVENAYNAFLAVI